MASSGDGLELAHTGRTAATTHHGTTAFDRALVRLLRSPLHRLFSRSVAVLRLRGTVSGRLITLPVQYAPCGADFVVAPGSPETKRWWRNLRAQSPVDLLVGGRWLSGSGVVLTPCDPGYASARWAYATRWPRVALGPANPVVFIAIDHPNGADDDDYPLD